MRIGIATFASVALAGSAMAQDAGDGPVTGSRLRLKDLAAASTVTVFDPEITYPAHHVPAYVAFDLSANHLFKNPAGNTTLAVGVHNLFDAKPPYVYNETFIFTDPGYDLIGRFVYGRVVLHAF